MSILLARTPTSNSIHTIPIEQSVHIHICNAVVLLSKKMIRKKNWNFSNKYFLSLVFASILLLSSFGVLMHNAFANAVINPVQSTDRGSIVSNAQLSSNVKHVNIQTDTNNKSMHIKSPSHIPPLILEQFMQSKICKNKCVHPKSQ